MDTRPTPTTKFSTEEIERAFEFSSAWIWENFTKAHGSDCSHQEEIEKLVNNVIQFTLFHLHGSILSSEGTEEEPKEPNNGSVTDETEETA